MAVFDEDPKSVLRSSRGGAGHVHAWDIRFHGVLVERRCAVGPTSFDPDRIHQSSIVFVSDLEQYVIDCKFSCRVVQAGAEHRRRWCDFGHFGVKMAMDAILLDQ